MTHWKSVFESAGSLPSSSLKNVAARCQTVSMNVKKKRKETSSVQNVETTSQESKSGVDLEIPFTLLLFFCWGICCVFLGFL